MFRNKSIQFKVTFIFIFVVLLCAGLFGGIASVSLTSISSQQINMVEKELKNSVISTMQDAGELAAERVSKLLKESFVPATILSELLAKTTNGHNSFNREQVKVMGQHALNASNTINALYIQFEPNGYDNRDDEFINSGNDHSTSIGSLETYWVKEGNKAVYYPIESTDDKYVSTLDENGIRASEWYLCSMESKKSCALDPYLYNISEDNKVLMTTLSSPVIVNSEFKGLVGVDINLPTVQKWIVEQADKLFDGQSSISLLSQKHLLVASNAFPNSLSKRVGNVNEALSKVVNSSKSILISDGTWFVKVPVYIEEADVTWTLIVSVPESVALASIAHMKESAREMYESAITDLILFSIAILAVAIFSAIFLAKSISSPIKIVSNTVQNLAEKEGDLTQNININNHKELILLAKGFNQFIHKLAEMIRASKSYSMELVGQFSKLSGIAEKVETDTQLQMNELDNIATAMTEMSTAAIEVAGLAKNTASGGYNANKLLTETQEMLNSSVNEASKLEESMQTTSEQVSQVAVRTTDITSIVETIRSIAEQTNLLALNAAIEAARAGEQGRGFAVVADEVRNLAGRTQTSTEEISDLIGNLQGDVDKAVLNLQGIQTSVSETVGKTNDSYTRLTSSLESIAQINESSEQVATAAEEQSQVAEDINTRLVSVSDSSRELALMGNDLLATSEASKELVGRMEKQLSRLKC